MSDDQLRRWFQQFQDSPAGPMRMPPVREIRRRVRVWWATRLGGALAVAAVVVWAGTLLAGQVGGDRAPTASPLPIPTLPPTDTPSPSSGPALLKPPPTLPHTRVTSPASNTVQLQPDVVRAGQTVTLRGRGCTAPGVRASRMQVVVEVESPDGNDRVAWLEYPVGADGSWQGQWRIPKLPGRIKYGPGFQLQPSCDILDYRKSKYDEGMQYVFSYDVQWLTIQPPA